MNIERLKARSPYGVAVRVGARLCPLDSPGAFEDWDIYWLAGLAALRAVWHCLWEQDRSQSDLLKEIIEDFNSVNWGATNPILKDFVRDGRNATLKRWDWYVSVQVVSHHRFLEPGISLGTSKDLLWQDEDALRLYEIALVDWHRSLCVIEQANKEGIRTPFSNLDYNKNLLNRSDFIETLPLTPRL